jgi:hypothetical protein
MKKSELRSLIREQVKNLLKEASYKPSDDQFIESWIHDELSKNGTFSHGDVEVKKAIESAKQEWKASASKFPTVRLYLMDLRKQGVFDELLESKITEANEMSFINKARAKSSLEQIKKGKRADGMGKFDAKVYAIKGTQEIELTDPSDLIKYSTGYKYGLKSESVIKEATMDSFADYYRSYDRDVRAAAVFLDKIIEESGAGSEELFDAITDLVDAVRADTDTEI